jgi:hypothetical protein
VGQCFFRLLSLPWITVTLDAMLGLEQLSQRHKKHQNFVTPPCKPIKHQSSSDFHRCSFGDHSSELPLVVFSCYPKFLLSIQSGQSGWHDWNSVMLKYSF